MILDILNVIWIALIYIVVFGGLLAPIFLCYRYAKKNNMNKAGLWAFGGFWLGWIMLLIQVLIYHNQLKKK